MEKRRNGWIAQLDLLLNLRESVLKWSKYYFFLDLKNQSKTLEAFEIEAPEIGSVKFAKVRLNNQVNYHQNLTNQELTGLFVSTENDSGKFYYSIFLIYFHFIHLFQRFKRKKGCGWIEKRRFVQNRKGLMLASKSFHCRGLRRECRCLGSSRRASFRETIRFRFARAPMFLKFIYKESFF